MGAHNCVVSGQAAFRYSVDEFTTAGRPNDLEVPIWNRYCRFGGDEDGQLIERTVGPVRVAMINVVNDKIVELAAAPDDGAVEELASTGCRASVRPTRSATGRAHRCR